METTTDEKIEVMKAYLEGKTIEFKLSLRMGCWTTLSADAEPTWNWGLYDYRVKATEESLISEE